MSLWASEKPGMGVQVKVFNHNHNAQTPEHEKKINAFLKENNVQIHKVETIAVGKTNMLTMIWYSSLEGFAAATGAK
jgi:hypothetical protein